MRLVFVCSFLVILGSAESGPGYYRYDYHKDMEIMIRLGTPYQGPFPFKITNFLTTFGWLPGISQMNAHHEGYFNQTASTSYRIIGSGPFPGAMLSQDTLQFDDGPTVEFTVFNLINDRFAKAELDLSRGEDGLESFADKFLKQLGGTAITFMVRESAKYRNNGSVIFGPSNPVGCSDHWSVYPSRTYSYVQFTMHIDQLQVGDFVQNENVPFAFTEGFLTLDEATRKKVERVLRVGMTGKMPCDQTMPIIFRAGSEEFTVGPDEYLSEFRGSCYFSVTSSAAKMIGIPLRNMRGRCVRFDFEMDTISVAKME